MPAFRLATCRATVDRKRPSARCWPQASRSCGRTSYADLTVRAVAARAKVAPATAYTYFSSKNHLIAEIYLDLVRQVPYFTDVNEPMPTRVDKALRHLALVVADEPEVAAACTTALLGGGGDPAVRSVRDRIGAEIHRRITSAIGPDAEPAHRVGTRDDVLRRARQRRQRRLHLPPDRRPPRLRGRPHPHRRKPDDHSIDKPLLDPYDYDFHEDPYPYYQRLRDEAPLYHNEELGFWALSRHQRRAPGLPQQHHAVQPIRRLTGPGLPRTARIQDHVVSGDGRPGASAAADPGVKRLHTQTDS